MDDSGNRPREALTGFTLDFLYDDDCDGPNAAVSATVTNLCIHVKDIDEGQFAQFKDISRYSLLDGSDLDVELHSNGFTRASELNVDEAEREMEEYWWEVEFDRTSSIEFGVGIGEPADEDYSNTWFAVTFGCASWEGRTVTQIPSAGSPSYDIDLDHYRERADEVENSLPDTK